MLKEILFLKLFFGRHDPSSAPIFFVPLCFTKKDIRSSWVADLLKFSLLLIKKKVRSMKTALSKRNI